MTVGRRPRLVGALFASGVAGALVLSGVAPAQAAPGGAPDLGPDVRVFGPDTPVEEINAYLQGISQTSEFSTDRHAVLFLPGTYGSAAGEDDPATATGIVNSEVGYYTSIQGLGASPGDVRINGALHVEPAPNANGTSSSLTRFWRSLGNMTVNPIQRPVGADAQRPRPEGIAEPHTMRWAVSQAAPLRRVDIEGDLDLTGRYFATAFGTYTAKQPRRGQVISGDVTLGPSQAQWFTRDSEIGGWNGLGVDHVFSGVQGAPPTDFGVGGGTTTLPTTPVSREAPFLFVEDGRWQVFVPSARTDTSGTHWGTGNRDGERIAIDRFFIARPSDSAAVINRQLAAGEHLLLTPGVYALDAPLRITRPDTVVMGLGYASLQPAAGTTALEVGDVHGVVVSGITVDAGANADVLVRVGTRGGGNVGHAQDPTTLTDVFVRVGGPREGQATTSLEVNSDHVLLDHTWLWRADHGTGAGWAANRADHGLVVNGDDVTALGLFVEHYQREQVVWNGERGRTVLFQSEMPYDPPSQAAWMDGTSEGYAAYVVADGVRKHEATGLVVYSLFLAAFGPGNPQIHATSAMQAPVRPTVQFRSMATGVIAAGGGIRHVVNDAGAAVDASQPNGTVSGMTAVTRPVAYPAR